MNKRQRKIHRRAISKQLKIVVGIMAGLALLGTVGHFERQDLAQQRLIDQEHYMAIQCHIQAPNCLHLIQQIEANGTSEVMSDYNDNYWVEQK